MVKKMCFQTKTINYKGWNVSLFSNKWLHLFVAPQLGGRIIQFQMAGHDFFFVNPVLAGTEPDETRLGKNGAWLNYGGEKVWPAPQGWDSPNQWPGPPDPVLDGGEYSITRDLSSENTFLLKSSFDPYTGLQIERSITMSENSSEVTIKARFKNHCNSLRQWSVWPVCQMNTAEISNGKKYQIICPVNPKSKFENGFKVMHGLVNSPQFNVNENGNLVVDYQYLVGKVGLDANSNWVAYHDKSTGKVFILKFSFEEDKDYPDDTSVQVWTQGRGIIFSRNKITEFRNDESVNPPYMEMELLSPLHSIQPGEKTEFEYRMLSTTIPLDSGITTIKDSVVVSSPLRISHENGCFLFTGQYGLFHAGTLRLSFKDSAGKNLEELNQLQLQSVSPLEGVTIILKLNAEQSGSISSITLSLFDENEKFIEEIETLNIETKI